jgi:hypothetical protein
MMVGGSLTKIYDAKREGEKKSKIKFRGMHKSCEGIGKLRKR